MASPTLSDEQAKKQSAALKKFHEDGKKGLAKTSAGSVKEPRALNNVRAKITGLTDPASDIISKAITGDLVAEKEVWKGKPEDKIQVLNDDPSASFEMLELPNGKTVEVLVRYYPVSKNRVEIAKWVITQDIMLKKAAEESKLRKLEVAMKNKKAQDEGAIAKVTEQAAVKKAAEEFGRPKLVLEYDPEWDDDPMLEDDE